MQRYYWAAKTVTQLNTILLQNIEAQLFPQPTWPCPINARFNEVNGLIDIAPTTRSSNTPSAMLEVFVADDRAPAPEGHDGAHHARAVARALRDRRRVPRTTRSTAPCSCASCRRRSAWCMRCAA